MSVALIQKESQNSYKNNCMLYGISGKYSEPTKNCCCRQDSEYKMMSRTELALHSKFDFTGLLFLCSWETSFCIWSKANWTCKDTYLILWPHSNHQKILRLTSLTRYTSQLIFLCYSTHRFAQVPGLKSLSWFPSGRCCFPYCMSALHDSKY